MSRTLSKVLIICALVVVLPLMVAGTAFAAYYAINATVSIEIFVDKTIDGASAEVSYKGKVGTVNDPLNITDGHLKKVTFKTDSVGYDFVGWYAGNYEAYTKELANGKTIETVDYAIKSADAKVDMTDYQNLVAVFKAKRFTVSYKYLQTPSALGGTGVEVTEVPVSKNGLIVDGKKPEEVEAEPSLTEEFVFGDKLHTLEFEGHPEYTFDGWYVGEDRTTKYTRATFAETNVLLTGEWKDSKRINLTYLDNNGNELEKITVNDENPIYANHKYTLKAYTEFESRLEEGFVQAGYSYGWQDANGNIVTEINAQDDVTLKLVRTPVAYTARVDFAGSGLSLKDGILDQVTFSVDEKGLPAVWNNASNWNSEHSYWHFDYLTYNNQKVENITDILNSVIATNPHETTEVVFKAVRSEDFTSYAITNIDYKSVVGVRPNGDVYKGEVKLIPMEIENASDFTSELTVMFNLMSEDDEEVLAQFFKNPEMQEEIKLTKIQIEGLGDIVFENLTTVYDLIDAIYAKVASINGDVSGFISEGTFTINNLVLVFQ